MLFVDTLKVENYPGATATFNFSTFNFSISMRHQNSRFISIRQKNYGLSIIYQMEKNTGINNWRHVQYTKQRKKILKKH